MNMQRKSVEKTQKSQEPEFKEALQFLEQVKVELVDKPSVYTEFMTIMKFQSANTRGVIERVKELFKGYDHLLAGFNNFLPQGYKIEVAVAKHVLAMDEAAEQSEVVPPEQGSVPGLVGLGATMPATPRSDSLAPPQEQAQVPTVIANTPATVAQVAARVTPLQQKKLLSASPNYTRAVAYVSIIKKKFQGQPHVFHEFLQILRAHSGGATPTEEVLQRMSVLFADHPDMYAEFVRFLPDHDQEKGQAASEKVAEAAKERKMTSNKRKSSNSADAAADPQAEVPGCVQEDGAAPEIEVPTPRKRTRPSRYKAQDADVAAAETPKGAHRLLRSAAPASLTPTTPSAASTATNTPTTTAASTVTTATAMSPLPESSVEVLTDMKNTGHW